MVAVPTKKIDAFSLVVRAVGWILVSLTVGRDAGTLDGATRRGDLSIVGSITRCGRAVMMDWSRENI